MSPRPDFLSYNSKPWSPIFNFQVNSQCRWWWGSKARPLLPKHYVRPYNMRWGEDHWPLFFEPSLSGPENMKFVLRVSWHFINGTGIIKVWGAPLLPFGAWMSSELLWHFTCICFLDYKTCGKLTFWPTGKAHWGFKLERVLFFFHCHLQRILLSGTVCQDVCPFFSSSSFTSAGSRIHHSTVDFAWACGLKGICIWFSVQPLDHNSTSFWETSFVKHVVLCSLCIFINLIARVNVS